MLEIEEGGTKKDNRCRNVIAEKIASSLNSGTKILEVDSSKQKQYMTKFREIKMVQT